MNVITQMPLGPYADVLMDRWFKRTFGWAPAKRLLMLFLNELIPERTIVDLSYGPQEHVNPVNAGKDVRMDVECTDQDGAKFIVEMQLSEQRGFYNRAVFNASFAIQEQIPRGERSFEYPPVYFIGIMNFSLHKGSDEVLFHYTIRENSTNELMTDSLQFLFLELPNCTKALSPEASVLDNFCYALMNLSRLQERPAGLQGEIFDLLFKSAKISNFARDEQTKYFEDMTTKEDIQRMINTAEDNGFERGMEQGLEQGVKQGLEQGVKQGVKQGLEQGLEQGRRAGREEVARRLLDRGFSVSDAAEVTGLSEEALQKL